MPDVSTPSRAPLTGVLLFTSAYMLAALAGAFLSGNREFVFYLAVMLVLIAVVWLVHRRVSLSSGMLWALAAWGALHMIGGLVPIPSGWQQDGAHSVFYSWWIIPQRLKYDQIVHAYGFGVTTWCCWQVIQTTLRDPDAAPLYPTFGLLALCVAAGMGFGALNEVIEFAAVLTIPNTNVGDYFNTGWDLVSNLVGGLVTAIVLRITHRK